MTSPLKSCLRSSAAAAGFVMAALPAFAATPSVIHVELDESGKNEVVKLDRSSVPAGKVTFEVSNASAMHEHELIVVKTPLKPDQFPTNTDKSRVDEKKLKGGKEVSDIKPGSKGQLAMDLTPGHYVLYCNYKNHFKDGMYAELEVTK